MPTDTLTIALNQMLSFYHKGIRNITTPNQPYRVGDEIGFEVFAKNVSPIYTLTNISGWIKHGAMTEFTSVYFSVPTMAPGAEASLGPEVRGKVVAVAQTHPIAGFWVETVGLVDATAAANLGSVTFKDSGMLIGGIPRGTPIAKAS
jgi:hypothetical protein